jgi:hypothetical protein
LQTLEEKKLTSPGIARQGLRDKSRIDKRVLDDRRNMADRLIVPYTMEPKILYNYLAEKGYPDAKNSGRLMIRDCKDKSRVEITLRTGTDRDENSHMWIHAEELRKWGIKPEEITFGQDFSRVMESFGDFTCHLVPFWINLIYDHEKIELVKCGERILEFYMYPARKGFTFRDALVAVIDPRRDRNILVQIVRQN